MQRAKIFSPLQELIADLLNVSPEEISEESEPEEPDSDPEEEEQIKE